MTENKSTVGGLFCANRPATNFSCHQQTGSLFNTHPKVATRTKSLDLSSKDEEDSVGGIGFGVNKTHTFAAASQPPTSNLFSLPRQQLPEEHLRGFSYGATKQPTQTIKSNQVDYELYDNRLATFAFWSCSDVVRPAQLARAGLIFAGLRDKCACPWCRVVLQSWEYFDEPLNEHQKYSPDCKFVEKVIPNVKANGITTRKSCIEPAR